MDTVPSLLTDVLFQIDQSQKWMHRQHVYAFLGLGNQQSILKHHICRKSSCEPESHIATETGILSPGTCNN